MYSFAKSLYFKLPPGNFPFYVSAATISWPAGDSLFSWPAGHTAGGQLVTWPSRNSGQRESRKGWIGIFRPVKTSLFSKTIVKIGGL